MLGITRQFVKIKCRILLDFLNNIRPEVDMESFLYEPMLILGYYDHTNKHLPGKFGFLGADLINNILVPMVGVVI